MSLEFIVGPLRVLPPLLMLSAKQMPVGSISVVVGEEEVVTDVLIEVDVDEVMGLGGSELLLVDKATVTVAVTVTVATHFDTVTVGK